VIKCVIWDLDDTLLDGVFLESPQRPPPVNAALLALLAELAGRGIVHAIASRNPPAAGAYAEEVTGHAFAAVRCGWDAKSAAVGAIMADLGLAADAVAFVDNDALERAEVAFAFPDVLVLAPQEMAEAANWAAFSPPVLTDEARRRGEFYANRRARLAEARAFGGSRAAFLRHCQTRVVIAPAGRADLPRLHELSVRTHQFNSAGAELTQAQFAGLLGSPGQRVVCVRLSDRFGDDGLVGGCVIDATAAPPGGWEVRLLMMSCRAIGRGVVDALLSWICLAARDAGAGQVGVACVINPRNVPLRIALTGNGFRASEPPDSQGQAHYVRGLDPSLPDLPSWVES
jgi:methoxymalonate biosynthesis protein